MNPQLNKVYQGKIIHVNSEQGYGFISSNDPDIRFTRIHFRWHGLTQETLHFTELKENDDVDFEVKITPKGLRAIKIDVVEPDADRKKKVKKNG